MIELCNHGLLILQVLFVLVNQRIPLVDDAANVVENLSICLLLQIRQGVIQSLVFSLLPLQLEVHVLDLGIVPLQFAEYHFFVAALLKLTLDLIEVRHNLGQLV